MERRSVLIGAPVRKTGALSLYSGVAEWLRRFSDKEEVGGSTPPITTKCSLTTGVSFAVVAEWLCSDLQNRLEKSICGFESRPRLQHSPECGIMA